MLEESFVESDDGNSMEMNGGETGQHEQGSPASAQPSPAKSTHSSRPASTSGKYKGIKAREVTKNGKTTTKFEDPNAPKKPRSGYVHFLSSARGKYGVARAGAEEQSNINRALASEWQSLPDAEKQKYHAIAQKEKVEYEKALAAYQKTPEYKMFTAQRDKILKEHGGDRKTTKKRSKTAVSSSDLDDGKRRRRRRSQLIPFDTDFSVPATGNVCIFSQEFLHFNRERETLLRSVRKAIGDAENEQQAVKRSVAKMHTNIDALRTQIEQDKKDIADCEAYLEQWTAVIRKAFEKCGTAASSALPADPSPESISAFIIALSSGRPSSLLDAARQAAHSIK